MTERTVIRQTLLEDDAISPTSTQESEYDPEKEFIVTRILAEKMQNGKKMFLILWEDYPEEKSTWEPKDHISPEILDAWKERKLRENRGIDVPFDVANFQATLQRLEKEKQQRKERRKAKRKRLGLAAGSSDSDKKMAGQDDTSSDEAIEEDDVDVGSTPATRASKRKSGSSLKQIRKPVRILGKGSSIQQVDDKSSDVPDAEPLSMSSTLKEQDEMHPSASKAQSEKVKLGQKPKGKRKSSTSSSDIPLMQQKQQQVPDPKGPSKGSDQAQPDIEEPDLRRPSSPRPDAQRPGQQRADQQLSDQTGPESSSSDASRVLQQSNSGAAREVPSMTPDPSQLFMSEGSPTEPDKRPRGRPPTRGKSATRGGGSVVHRNVFEAGEAQKTRGRKMGNNLLKHAMDPSKEQKMFGNRRLIRKAELQGRDMAEAAPDLSALGGLFNPANPSSFQPVRPSTLRKSSSNTLAAGVQDDAGEDADLDDLFEENKDPPNPTIRTTSAVLQPPTYQPVAKPSTSKQICFFWDRAQRDTRNPTCSNGYTCRYLHEYVPGAVVAPPPPRFVEAYGDASDSTPRRQFDAGDGSSLPKVRPPLQVEFVPSREQGLQSPPNNTTATQTPTLSTVPPRQSVPTAASNMPPPSQSAQPPWQQQSDPIDRAAVQSQKPLTRPSWDPYQPLDAICHFYHTRGTCSKGNKCKYYHSSDARLPVVPLPSEQREIQARTTCPEWMKGTCQHSDRDCFFLHGYNRVMASVPNHSGPSTIKTEPAVAETTVLRAPTEPRKKSVRFLLDEPSMVSTKLEVSTPTTEAHDMRSHQGSKTGYNEVCRFWVRGYCERGSFCRYQHGYRFGERDQRTGNEDVEMPDRIEDQHGSQPGDSTSYTPMPRIPRAEAPPNSTASTSYASRPPVPGVEAPQNTAIASKLPETNSLAVPTETLPPLPSPVVDDVVPTIPSVKNPRNKVSIAEYHRHKELQKLGARAKEVTFGHDELETVILDFGDIQHAEDSPWKQEYANINKIIFGHLCMAQDFRAQQGFLQRRALFRGSLVPADPGDQRAIETIEKVGDELVLRSAGLVSSLPNFAILLFPASKEEWRYLEVSSDYPKEGRLRYFVFQTDSEIDIPQDSTSIGIKLGEPYRKLMMNMLYGLDSNELIPRVEAHQNPYKFFLLFPSIANHTAEFIAAWLKDCHPSSKIYDAQKAGAWDYFRKSVDIGVVMIHETAIADIDCTPHLFDVVTKKNFAFWCISETTTPYPMFPSWQLEPVATLGRITATRLFPHGCAMLLTPSFLVAEPQRAYDLMKWFLNKAETSTPGTWKMVTAHNICDYVLDLAISKALEKDAFEVENRDNPAKDALLNDAGLSFAHCEARNKLHKLLVFLDMKGKLDSSIYDSDSSECYFREEREGPIVLADHYVDPDDEPALIEWFAGWSMCKLDIFKKFVVVGTGPSSSQRAKSMKEIVVGTVEEEDESGTVPSRGPEQSEKTESGIASSDTQGVNFRSFSITKEENFPPSDNEGPPTNQNPRQTALGVAVRLTPLSPDNNSAKSRAQEGNSKMASPTPANTQDQGRHGINDSLPLDHLQFCAQAGGSANDAATYIARAGSDVRRAIEMHNGEHGDDSMDIDVDIQVSQLIASEGKRTPLRIATANEDLARARQLNAMPSASLPNTSPSDGPGAAQMPQFDGAFDAYSPQYDGTTGRPNSSSSVSATRSGIMTGENGQRFVPRSVRPDMSVRKEISVRPGYTPPEDIERYVSPQVTASRSASRTASAINSPPVIRDTDAMDIDTGADADAKNDDTDTVTGTHGEPRNRKKKLGVEKEYKQYSYEATTSWYERYKETNGGGWEHIFVGAHDNAIHKAGALK